MRGWFIDDAVRPPFALPPRYLVRSNVIEESRATLNALADACAFARECSNTNRPVRWRPFEITDGEFPGFILDSPALRDALSRAERLGFLGERQGYESLSSPDQVTVIRIIRGVSPILRGYVEHVQTVPLRSDARVALYLKISGLSDILNRDHHGVGWHFHYCDKDGRRSDTMLSFDTNQPPRTEKDGRQVPFEENAPLFWERHSEANKKFDACPEDWGTKKRSSIFSAAQPQLTKLKPHDFRRPAAVARPVWPVGSTLSPPPAMPKSSG
ncbi:MULTISPECIES: hypothetical protein [unclassified Bradyrhizobium]|uniref:hypothetical protein n=1 Tax=Bradyrhizobium sp. USDA 4541 TaxID=2817704 RepID=UPI0020A57942|nr:hypothetical protein [Bradyrhizobium sp. USDA 4541]MCP1848388.1 hypothetical protein [Bradyrhizobium sp. USDA 4541]